MHIAKLSVGALLAIALLAGCAQDGPGTKQTVGGVAGAILGGIAGAQFGSGTGQLIATGVGAAAGLLIGSELGRGLDDLDRRRAMDAQTAATRAPMGETITWSNPNSGNSGSYTPVREGTRNSGEYCREFQETVTIGGETETAYGIACRKPDGSWEIQ